MSDELKIKSFIDEDDNEYYVERELGSGGQGAVYKIKGKNLVCKVLLDNKGDVCQSDSMYNSFRNNIEEVMVLDLPNNIKISRPKFFLKKPYCGYIMDLMDSMIPLMDIMTPNSNDNISDFYKNTGGILKRIKILKKLSNILETLRRRAIVYADLSPNNIFISKDIHESEVWLIDSDNMRYAMDFKNVICTPGYAAPEVFSGRRSNDCFSDSYSFAIIAFHMLTFTHPFIGEAVLKPKESNNNGDNWEDNNDPYSKAYKGEFPWILDKNDRSNYCDIKYLPENFVPYTDKMYELFDRTFSLEARNTPNIRPHMIEWHEALSDALNMILECDCENSFIKTKGLDNCPFCNKERNKVYVLTSYKVYKNSLLDLEDLHNKRAINIENAEDELKNINKVIAEKTKKRKILKNTLVKEREIISYSDIGLKRFLDEADYDIFYIDCINDDEYIITNKSEYKLYVHSEGKSYIVEESFHINSINNIKIIFDENEKNVSVYVFDIRLV